MPQNDTPVEVYGAGWCEDTSRTRQHLDQLGVSYRYHDVDQDPAAKQWVIDHNGGRQRTPTLDVAGTILSVPEDEQLDRTLHDRGLMSKHARHRNPS